MWGRILAVVTFLAVVGCLPQGWGKDSPGGSSDDLAELSLEELSELDVVVTSVSKKEEKLTEAPSAITVLTQEDIRRSGASSIPEALRMVPGLQVTHIDSNKWSISARGFNNQFANKLLVLIDGRSVYTPLFSGVFWDVQDVLMEDIERIEVIRGPGATLWGANAVNGVINITTKNAKDTQGGLISSTYGSEEKEIGIRQGWQLPNGAYLRTWGKFKDIDGFKDAADDDTPDDWSMERGGFRLDWDAGCEDTLTLQGDIYNGDFSESDVFPALTPPYFDARSTDGDVAGGNIRLNWNHKFSETSNMNLQLYYDRTERSIGDYFREQRDTYDVDFNHSFQLGCNQEIIWGLGYRQTSDDVMQGALVTTYPAQRKDDLYNAFVQDTITLVEDKLKLTLGTKFEYNDYTGVELQPSARLAFTPDNRNTTWLAVSRAVRSPSRIEHDGLVIVSAFPNPADPNLPPIAAAYVGNPDYDSEELIAYELGHRIKLSDRLSLDTAGFINSYDNLSTLEGGAPYLSLNPLPAHIVAPLYFSNQMDGTTYGIEASATYQPTDRWKLIAGYTYIDLQLHTDRSSRDLATEASTESSTPQNQFHLRSFLDLPCNLELDMGVYAVQSVDAFDIPSYVRLDTRLGYRPNERMELSVGFQNVLDDRHPEFAGGLYSQPTEVEHAVYAKMVYRF